MERPLTGWGFQTGGYVGAGAEAFFGYTNSYLQIFVDLGLIGLAWLLVGLFWTARRGRHLYRLGVQNWGEFGLDYSILAGIFAGGVLDAIFESYLVGVGNFVTFIFWVSLAALLKLAYLIRVGHLRPLGGIALESGRA
jgi:hypothetical protein